MSDEECKALVEQLVAILRSQGRGWVSDQALEQIREGNLQFKREDSRLPFFSERVRGLSRVKDRVVYIQTYTPREQLSLVLDAIERATSDVIAIASDVLRFAKDFGMLSQVTFVDEEVGQLVINEDEIDRQRQEVVHLMELVSELRRRVNDDG